MNWIDFTVCLCVSIALLGVLFYKLYPVIFKNKKHLSRRSKERIKDYYKQKKKDEQKKGGVALPFSLKAYLLLLIVFSPSIRTTSP